MEPRKSLQAGNIELCAESHVLQRPACKGNAQEACHEYCMHVECCLLRKSTHLCVTESNMKLPFTLSAATHPSCVPVSGHVSFHTSQYSINLAAQLCLALRLRFLDIKRTMGLVPPYAVVPCNEAGILQT